MGNLKLVFAVHHTYTYSMNVGTRHSTSLTKHGFTIVELLVVIVVIGILATITIISYTGIRQRAVASLLQSDLDNASRQLKLDQVLNDGKYPTDLASANNGRGIDHSPDSSLFYSADNTTNPSSFCITAVSGDQKYKVTNDSAPTSGVCLDYGMVISLDAGNTASYSDPSTTWTDLSGNDNNATLFGGVTYNSDGNGTLVFDGINGYGQIINNSSLDFSSEQTLIMVLKHSFTTGRKNPWNQAYGGYGTWTHENGTFINQFWGNSGVNNSPYTSFPSATTTTNVWNFMCATRDTSSASWYLNGALNSTRSNPYGKLASTSANILIGNGYAGWWQGEISVIKAYNRALTATEVQQIFNKLRGRYGL